MSTPIMPPTADWPSLAPRPGTITWRRTGDVRVLIAAGYALLLQVSHPTVGAGVSEHSQFKRDPWGRLLRTLDYTCTMVYGGPRAAGEMGRRIRSFHGQIKGVRPDGQRYHALEPVAYAWVHATLAETIVLAHERFGRPFTGEQRERFWAEWRSLGLLLGIRAGELPADWPGFREYFDEMVERELEHTRAVDEVLEAIARPAPPALPGPFRPAWSIARPQLGHFLGVSTVGLLAPSLRQRFGLRWTRADDLELRVLGTALRAATPLMPPSLRNVGPGYLRWRREAIARSDVASALPRAASPSRRP
ncbi:MAG: oxygenase MpaB family protein [Solirubrobacteraceae bacterium]